MKISRRSFLKGFGVLAAGAAMPPRFERPTNSALFVRTTKFEAINVITVDGTEFMPGDSPQRIKYLIAYGMSGREYQVPPGTRTFDLLLARFT